MHSSTEWLQHFQRNAERLLPIPWERGAELTGFEARAIAASVAEFQRGESGEGRRLTRYAEAYARATGDHDYAAAIRLFIGEEQRHARDLARFLALNHLPLACSTATDSTFRRLRHLIGTLEVSIAVLITAELIAQVYYEALRRATASTVLQQLCVQILRDEASHVEFQAERLGILRARRRLLWYWATMLCQRGLFAATCSVIWPVHRRVFRTGGFTFGTYWRAAWRCFSDAFGVSGSVRQRRQLPLRRAARLNEANETSGVG
jgi:hypothetical protein